ncbi:ATP-binding protein [Konateibacter massiliensis]|uniref:ATP-binding protein n=1 Tax=Konateibacter massiliensis TaxID=2002841 RepID=UPI000C161537|nr:ATP-binding protein [Konateibacter massiliensis]
MENLKNRAGLATSEPERNREMDAEYLEYLELCELSNRNTEIMMSFEAKDYWGATGKNKEERDALTNLYSNSYGEGLIRKYLSKKQVQDCSLFVIDMDNFALINDTYGVMFGDILLKEVTEIVQKISKSEDILVRLGGDEILVFLTDSSYENGIRFAKRLCDKVERIYSGEKKEITMSCSIGIAQSLHVKSFSELYNNAIIALEYAKQANKGGYISYDDKLKDMQIRIKQDYLNRHLVRAIKNNQDESEDNMINFAFSLLEKSKDLPSGINMLLSRIGKVYDLERVSVMEIDMDFFNIQYTYQWAKEIKNLSVGNSYYLGKERYRQMENKYEMKSICEESNEFYSLNSCLHAPIYDMGVYCGSVCFEKNKKDYAWSDEIKRFLKEIAQIISTYILKIKADSESRAKADFLSRMSHEIRTPMNAIIGMTSIAKSAINDREKVEDCLDKIEKSTKYLISIVNDILDMSKIESGKMVILNQSFDLRKLVREIEAMIKPQVDDKQINFLIEENYNGYILMGDELRLSQILLNILGNAVKFTEEKGEIIFKIEQTEQEKDSATIRFSVKDSGIGISKENIKRIFNSFEQAEDNTSRDYGGTGLGLSISANLVQKMGGTLEVKSKYKKGSEFFFTIRFQMGHADEASEKEKYSVSEDYHFDGKRVLVVEDNSLNMEIQRSLLEMAGCIVEGAKNGREAVKSFESNPAYYYDIILMDIRMPVMDGLEATKRIRNSEREDAKTVPIIATTANAFDADAKKSLESGMDGHLSKPIEIKHLYEVVSRAMRNNAGVSKPVNLLMERQCFPTYRDSQIIMAAIREKREADRREAEKREEEMRKRKETQEADSDIFSALHIEGIDMEMARKYFNGNGEIYLEILGHVCEDAKNCKKRIITCKRNDDWKGYEIQVHGLKGVAASIGASAFSEYAKRHETASKNNDTDFIKEDFPVFIQEYDRLVEKIQKKIKNETV